MVRCATCGTENDPPGQFCISCGSPLRGRVATAEEPAVEIPEWVFPDRAPATPPAIPVPPGRPVKFLVLLILWFGITLALPAWTVWSTSPFLREAGPGEYFDRIPTCEESARAAGDDPELCSDAEIRARFDIVSDQVSEERERVVKFAGFAYGALILGTLILVMAAGLRPWWTFSLLFTPLAIFVWVWSLWRLSAFPARPWENRRA